MKTLILNHWDCGRFSPLVVVVGDGVVFTQTHDREYSGPHRDIRTTVWAGGKCFWVTENVPQIAAALGAEKVKGI